jgi:hypothetical protein
MLRPMQTKRIREAVTITANPETNAFDVCLVSEGVGSSADFPREVFTQENADALAGSLSFPNHPRWLDSPEERDPMSAIGQIAESVVPRVDPETGLMGMWSQYLPAQSKPEVAPYLEEFHKKLALSIFIDSNGHVDPDSGRWVVRSFDGSDPYKSVDVVIAAGRGGKFERLSESLGIVTKTSATAEEKKENPMEIKEVGDAVAALTKVVEGLAKALNEKASADSQIKADDAAVAKTVESRFGEYDAAVTLITEAKLTESQSAELRALAKTGVDITPNIESAKKVLAEARASVESDEDESRKTAETHLGGGKVTDAAKTGFAVPGFGGMN